MQPKTKKRSRKAKTKTEDQDIEIVAEDGETAVKDENTADAKENGVSSDSAPDSAEDVAPTQKRHKKASKAVSKNAKTKTAPSKKVRYPAAWHIR